MDITTVWWMTVFPFLNIAICFNTVLHCTFSRPCCLMRNLFFFIKNHSLYSTRLMGMNDLWGKYYNCRHINNYWKRGIRSQLICYGKNKLLGFRGLFHTRKHSSNLCIWIIAECMVSTKDIAKPLLCVIDAPLCSECKSESLLRVIKGGSFTQTFQNNGQWLVGL